MSAVVAVRDQYCCRSHRSILHCPQLAAVLGDWLPQPPVMVMVVAEVVTVMVMM